MLLAMQLQPSAAWAAAPKADPCKLVSEATLRKLTGVSLKRGKNQPMRDPNNGTAQCSYGFDGKTTTHIAMITVMTAQNFRRYYGTWAADALKEGRCVFSLNISVRTDKDGIKAPTPTPLPPDVQSFVDKPWPEFFASYRKAEDLCESYTEAIPKTNGVVIGGALRELFVLGAQAMLPKGEQVLVVAYAELPHDGNQPSRPVSPASTPNAAQKKELMKQATQSWRTNALKIVQAAVAGL
jgi:hypothetical protein